MTSASVSGVCILGRTDEYSEIERTRLEVVFENEPRCDRDGICNVEPGHGECEDGIDSLSAREGEEAKEGGNRGDEPNGIHRGASVAIHAVQYA